MGRRPRNERIEIDEDDRDDRKATRDSKKDDDRAMFEEPVFVAENESALYVPEHLIPPGYKARWVRTEAANAVDNVNWSKMTRKGWQPLLRKDHPELDAMFPSVAIPGVGDTSGGAFYMGGLCLCVRDARLVERDRKRQEQDTRDQLRTVETYVEGGNSMFPRFNQSGPLQVENARAPARFKE